MTVGMKCFAVCPLLNVCLLQKVSTRVRHASSNRRGNYSYDRGEQHADREGNWNTSSKSRARGHNRSQTEKPTSRIDRIAGGDSQNDRTWGSYRHGSFPSYQSQNNPIRASTSQGVPANMSYGMYPLPGINSTSMVQSNGPIPSVVMLYPYDQNARYNSSSEQLEFGSFGALGFSGVNDVPQLIEGHQSPSPVDERRLHAVPTTLSSPDQPSSPHVMRWYLTALENWLSFCKVWVIQNTQKPLHSSLSCGSSCPVDEMICKLLCLP